MRNQFKISLAVFVIILSSCSGSGIQEKPDEEIILHYNNGEKFCEGFHRVYEEGNSERKNRKGIWKFYSLDGKLESIIEYDKFGDLKSKKTYDENSNLVVSEINSETQNTYFEFYEDGNVKDEIITRIEFELYEEDEYETYYYTTIKEYFINGQLKSQKEAVDDELQGKASKWDKNGNLIIEYEYVDGLIILK